MFFSGHQPKQPIQPMHSIIAFHISTQCYSPMTTTTNPLACQSDAFMVKIVPDRHLRPKDPIPKHSTPLPGIGPRPTKPWVIRGGVVFYVDDIGEHGLVAAPYDQGSAKWGCYTHLIGGTTTLFGSGQYNTNIILIGCNQSGIPARVCNDLVLNGYDDWFLPSQDELNEMYLHENEIGGFTNNSYWSSSEYNYLNSWQISFFTGVGGWSSKESLFYIRAIRDF